MDISPGSTIIYGLPLNDDFSLVCSGVLTSSFPLRKLHVKENIRVQWSDKDGPIQNLENSTVSGVSLNGSVLRSTLHFHPLGDGHDRLYICSMTLNTPAFSMVPSDTSQFRVIFGELILQIRQSVLYINM